jgi:hypothetical protein
MSEAFSRITYQGANPGADANAYTLFSTHASGWGECVTAGVGAHRFAGNISCTNATGCSIVLQKTRDMGTTWRTVSTQAIASGTSIDFDVVVEGYRHWRLVWNNNSNAQTIFEPDMALIGERVVTT